jgi:uncharacterized protein
MDREQLGHLEQNERLALEAFVHGLQEQYPEQVVRVVLFGSKARGDSDDESDLDVLVVVDDGDWKFRDAVTLVAFEPMLDYDVVLSPLIVDVDEYDWWQEYHAPIYRHIRSEGVELWTKQSVS